MGNLSENRTNCIEANENKASYGNFIINTNVVMVPAYITQK